MRKDEIVNELFAATNEFGVAEVLDAVLGSSVKISIALSQKTCDMGIDTLDFSVRANNAMKRAGLFTLGEVAEIIASGELAKIRNLGKKTENEIKTRLLVYGYERLSDKEKKEFLADTLELNGVGQ